MKHRLETPLTREKAGVLEAGDEVYISGIIYAARDAAHKRFFELLDRGEALPFPIEDSVIYYTGPSPAAPGKVIGAAGPTTSGRMDAYTPRLLDLGMRGMIGKGRRTEEVIRAMRQAGAVYFGAIGGAGALLSRRVKSAEIAAFPDLGTEALRILVVEDFPVTVAIDSLGRDLYEIGKKAYLEHTRLSL